MWPLGQVQGWRSDAGGLDVAVGVGADVAVGMGCAVEVAVPVATAGA